MKPDPMTHAVNAKNLAELALKVWAVLLLIQALLALPTAVSLYSVVHDATDPQAGLYLATQRGYLLNIVLQAIAGIVVLVWADKIVALFESGTTPLQIDATRTDLQVLAFAIAGIFILVGGLQNVAGAASVLFGKPAFDRTGTFEYLWARQGEAMTKSVVQMVAGAFLIFGRDALVRGWSTLRGIREPDLVMAGTFDSEGQSDEDGHSEKEGQPDAEERSGKEGPSGDGGR